MEFQLRNIRKAAKLTQGRLAAMLLVDIKTIGNWELGKTTPDIEQLWELAVALGCTPNDLLGWGLSHPDDAAPRLSQDEAVLLSDYRECTPARRSKAAEAVRDQRDLSKESEAASRSREEGAA